MQPSLSMNSFEVTEHSVARESLTILENKGKAWSKKALDKQINSLDKEGRVKFSDCMSICQILHKGINQFREHQKILICRKQGDKKIQAIAIFLKCVEIDSLGKNWGVCLEIQYLVTNPKNIRSEVNRQQNSITAGSATAIITYLYQRCLKEHLEGIYLESYPAALEFYKKLHFKEITRGLLSINSGLFPLILLTKSSF